MRSKKAACRATRSCARAVRSPAGLRPRMSGRAVSATRAPISANRLSMSENRRNTVRRPTLARSATCCAVGWRIPSPTSASIASTIARPLRSRRRTRPSAESAASLPIAIAADCGIVRATIEELSWRLRFVRDKGEPMAIYPTSKQIDELLAGPAGRPVVMLNLLRFKLQADAPDAGISGEEAYRRYATPMTQFVASRGGRVLWTGRVDSQVIDTGGEAFH